MPRIPKKYINTSFFHIMVQGINKEYIFDDEKDIRKYLKILKEAKKEVELQIIAYCIMNNHAHILIYTNGIDNLVKVMHKTNLTYAKYYNKKYDRVGYVFRDRYKTQPILSEEHLYCCIDYIHNNPVKANICDNPVKYKYSSYSGNYFQTESIIYDNIRKYINEKEIAKNDRNIFIFMEDDMSKSEICEEYIKQFVLKNNIKVNEIKDNKNLLIEVVKDLRDKYKISYTTIGEYIGINRETLRKLVINTSKLK